MTPDADLGALARRIVDAIMYMTLATADDEGRPWASPVWYAPATSTEFFWVSEPDARHSRNLAIRREVGIVIFDSTVPIGAAEGVYLEAVAEELAGGELDRAIAIYSGRSKDVGAPRVDHRRRKPSRALSPLSGHRLCRVRAGPERPASSREPRTAHSVGVERR